jgi:hypothetical protein
MKADKQPQTQNLKGANHHMRKTLDQRIEANKLAIENLQKEQAVLLAEYDKREEAAKKDRIYTRGEQVETALPEIIPLTKTQFDKFIERVLLTEYTRREIKKIIAEDAPPATPKPADTAAQLSALPAQKPAGATSQ